MSFWAQLIASNLVMACLMGGLAWLVGRNGRRATLAHSLWLLVFIKLVTPPLVTVPLPIPETWWFAPADATASTPAEVTSVVLGETEATTANTSNALLPQAVAPPQPTSSRLIPRVTWWQVLLTVWLVGFLWIAVRGSVKLIRFDRLLRRSGTVDPEATSFVRGLLASAGDSTSLARTPQVLRVPMRVSPMLFGLGTRTFIVCPESLWNAFGEEERRAFLAHETAHFYRRDHWGRWLEWSVTALYWWFPLVYLARRQLERHEEACCDAWAVRMLAASPRQYAEALLQVVDFISEYQVGMVRLASGMQPTYTLEERLHLIMKGGPAVDQARRLLNGLTLACVLLCGLHPIVKTYRPLPSITPEVASKQPHQQTSDAGQVDSAASGVPADEPIALPPAPEGFWNKKPQPRWADVALSLPGARMVAEANAGIRFITASGKTLQFETDELTSVAEIAATKRVVIGDRQGQLRLWDLAAAMPVSLIGQHPAPVTSVAYHDQAGVISADEAGSVIRWNLQSGQVLATWTEAAQPVQSIRVSADGQTLAILCGQWEDLGQPQRVVLVDSQTLRTQLNMTAPSGTAVVVPASPSRWNVVHWSGQVFDLETGQPMGRLPKHTVSALALCQDSPLQTSAERASP